ncbi:MAG: carboxypeptidase-like regulatory domain-containing protein [Streptosporangiaceae bacterium]
MLVLAAVISGCGTGSGRHGQVIGHLLAVGGPAPGQDRPLPGRVVATTAAGQRVTVTVGPAGRYTISLPPGTYTLTGYSPHVRSGHGEMRCTAMHPVTVRASHRALRNVICPIR